MQFKSLLSSHDINNHVLAFSIDENKFIDTLLCELNNPDCFSWEGDYLDIIKSKRFYFNRHPDHFFLISIEDENKYQFSTCYYTITLMTVTHYDDDDLMPRLNGIDCRGVFYLKSSDKFLFKQKFEFLDTRLHHQSLPPNNIFVKNHAQMMLLYRKKVLSYVSDTVMNFIEKKEVEQIINFHLMQEL